MKPVMTKSALVAQAVAIGFCLLTACDEPRSVRVSPSSDLDAIQRVTVSGSRLPAGASVTIYQCFGSASCELIGSVSVGSDGMYSGVVQVEQTRNGFACDAPGKCSIGVKINEVAAPAVPLSFKAVGSSVVGTVQVASSPVAGEPIQVTGSGWASNTAVYFSLCSESSSCSSGLAIANASGNFSSPAPARFFREQGGWSTTTGALLVRLVDTPLPAAYTLTARDFRSDTDTTVPVTVQPGAVAVGTASVQLPIPRVAPTTTLEGGGWPANQRLIAYQCKTGTTDCVGVSGFSSDSSGAFSVSTPVQWRVTVHNPFNAASFTCHDTPNQCYLVVTYADARATLAASPHIPLEFMQE